jgi:dTDP-4-dehydrorhamnose reductase
MKILLLGKNGQVGWELQRSLAVLGDLIALDRQRDGDLCGDLAEPEALRKAIRTVRPDIIVNAAAYTAVDKAETESELAWQVNAHACKVLAEEALALNAWLVHYSTDYVFDGKGETPWAETDQVDPLNQYGASKLAGEQFVVASGCNYLIFRTSWVYAARGNNFAKTILRLASERESLNIIADQVGAPTGAELIADVTSHALKQAVGGADVTGVYHLAAAGEVSWHGYANHIVSVAQEQGVQLKVRAVDPIKTSEYPTPARRPYNSRLNTQKLRENFSIHLPDWKVGVTRMLMEVLNK